MKYYNEAIETMPRDAMRALQSERLRNTVERMYAYVAPYRRLMDEAGVKPSDIRTIDDITKLPFLSSENLRENYPLGMIAVPREKTTRIHASSGTTGKPKVVAYTQHDVDVWSECVARCIVSAGAGENDVIQVAYGYGLFTGGLGLHYGAENLGATVIPTSSGNTLRQIEMMIDLGSTYLCCTPSYALYIADTMEKNNIPVELLSLKGGIFGAEPWTEEMRREIEKCLNIKAYDIYGIAEITGPGVACDCECQNGMHVNEDNFYIEIIDLVTGEPLPDGERGEVVFSCINKEALPLLRYRTHDISYITREKCECGRTLVRLMKPSGRTDDMIIVRGINVFPSQIESVLLSVKGVSPHYLIIVDRHDNHDTIEVKVEVSPEIFSDKIRGLQSYAEEIQRKMDSVLQISAKITFVEPGTLPRSEGKAKRVIDNRKLYT
ncbi:MAG: phenylacetate--CoA ligase [Eubacteriales bacterium]|jgi:phenylacetate-CoA ligase|nr:phenylacetate--CoA ligase [Clostridiales bacterium]